MHDAWKGGEYKNENVEEGSMQKDRETKYSKTEKERTSGLYHMNAILSDNEIDIKTNSAKRANMSSSSLLFAVNSNH